MYLHGNERIMKTSHSWSKTCHAGHFLILPVQRFTVHFGKKWILRNWKESSVQIRCTSPADGSRASFWNLLSKKSTDDGQGPREENFFNNYWLFTVDCHNFTETNSQLAACTSIQVNQILHLFNQIITLCNALNIKNTPEFIRLEWY